jgi:hypothetical protein
MMNCMVSGPVDYSVGCPVRANVRVLGLTCRVFQWSRIAQRQTKASAIQSEWGRIWDTRGTEVLVQFHPTINTK